MQQWLSNLGSPDLRGPWLIVIAAVAALLILYFLYRFVFGHRLRVPAGGRTRQPRLGLVDARLRDSNVHRRFSGGGRRERHRHRLKHFSFERIQRLPRQ